MPPLPLNQIFGSPWTATQSFFLIRPTRLGLSTVRAARKAKKCIIRLDLVRLPRERIRSKLEAHYLRQGALAGLEVEHRSRRIRRPQ